MTGSRARWPTVAASALVLVALTLGSAGAQVIKNVDDKPFHERYDVVGRIVDEDGWPVNQFFLDIEIEGLRDARVKPLRVGSNCNGDFGGVFEVGTLRGKNAKVTVGVHPQQFFPSVKDLEVTQDLDTFFRLNQFTIVLPGSWPSECGRSHEYWPGRVTAAGRFIDGVGKHAVNETRYLYGEPHQFWPLGLNVTLNTGGRFGPDSVIPTDERGDFQYSWTFKYTVTGANMTVAAKGVEETVPVDITARIAWFKIFTGEAPKLAPGAGAALALAAVALAALAFARRPRA